MAWTWKASPKDDAMTEPAYLATLNEAQKEAVTHFGSPLLILAGAGSGKTRVITTKIAWMMDRQGMSPRSILAVTFTNKAAQEMKERVLKLVPAAEEPMIRTFHSFGAWLLRRNAHLIGLDPGFLIYDEEDSQSLLKSAMGPDGDRNAVRQALRDIGRLKDLCIAADANAEEIAREGCAPEVYRLYEEALRRTGNVDFGDLILLCVRLLHDHPEVRERTRQRFRAILVDEYQDSNIAQFRLLRELSDPAGFLCVVGDDDQSIYRFRGAEVGNILGFSDAFPGTRIVRLEQNYRSTQAILDVASAVVGRNKGRLGKRLWTSRAGGKRPVIAYLEDQDDEAAFCAKLLADGNLEGTAVLYRMNSQSRTFEDLFTRRRIPHRVVGTVRFWNREEVKDAIAYLSLLANPRDEVSFQRIANKPPRGLGRSSLEKVRARWMAEGGSLWDACTALSDALPAKARGGLRELSGLHGRLETELDARPLAEFVHFLLQETGLYELYKAKDRSEDTAKKANLEELVNATSSYGMGREALAGFLENVSLDSSVGEEEERPSGRVTLITLHNTKGTEYDRVIVTGLEEGIFPHEAGAGDAEELEEERRLFYVGITRARNELYLTCCRKRRLFGRETEREPSRFLEEIPGEDVEVLGRTEAGEPACGEDDGWPLGAGVFHDDYGPGRIEGKKYTEGRLLVTVRFQSGKVARFLPQYARLERISTDE